MQEDWLEVSQADLDTLLQDYNRSGVSVYSEYVSAVFRLLAIRVGGSRGGPTTLRERTSTASVESVGFLASTGEVVSPSVC